MILFSANSNADRAGACPLIVPTSKMFTFRSDYKRSLFPSILLFTSLLLLHHFFLSSKIGAVS
jgi:hypothetical protein